MSRAPRARRGAACRLAVAFATLVAASPGARADDINRPAAPEMSWYGWQTLLSDAGALGLWSLAASQGDNAGSTALVVAGFLAYGAGGPAIHFANGHADNARWSIGLRFGLALGGAFVGLLAGVGTCGSSIDQCQLAFTGLGFIAGGLSAVIADAVVIAYAPARPSTGRRLQTAFVPTGGGGTLLLGGRF